jgi:hypothetical protein
LLFVPPERLDKYYRKRRRNRVDLYERLNATLNGMERESLAIKTTSELVKQGSPHKRESLRRAQHVYGRASTLLAMAQDVLGYTVKLKNEVRRGR